MHPITAYNLHPQAWDYAAQRIGVDVTWLLTVCGFETGHSFNPAQQNFAGSGATGLIQFMPSTAQLLGTTTAALANMTVPQQLEYVVAYFQLPGNGAPYNDVGSLYMAVFMPAHKNKPDDYIVIDQDTRPNTYNQNKGLDTNKDGKITRGEIVARIYNLYAEHWYYNTTPNNTPTPTSQPQPDPNAHSNGAKKKLRIANHPTIWRLRPIPNNKINKKRRNGKPKKK